MPITLHQRDTRVGSSAGDITAAEQSSDARKIEASCNSLAVEYLSGRFTTLVNSVVYPVILSVPFNGKIVRVVTKSLSGTCTMRARINTTNVTATGNSVSPTKDTRTQSAANTFVKDDDIAFVTGVNSAIADVDWTMVIERVIG